MELVKAEYLGHSCFCLTGMGQRIVLDPYSDGAVPGLENLNVEAEFVYCSHGHGDHNGVSGVKLVGDGAPKFSLTEIETDHDNAGGSLRGKNIIRVFDFGGTRVAHFGDLGRELTEDEVRALTGLDCVLIPVGGHFTIDAKQAADIVKKIAPKLVIPMHYRTAETGYEVLAGKDEALACFDDSVNLLPLEVEKATVFGKEYKDMNIEEKGLYYHVRGFNCCQSVLCSLGDYTGLPEETAAAIGSGFGGGMRCGSICGAVTGSMMAIGLTCFAGKDPAAEKEHSTELTLELQEKFRDEIGVITCDEITGAHENTLCDHCIAFGAETAKAIIEKNKI